MTANPIIKNEFVPWLIIFSVGAVLWMIVPAQFCFLPCLFLTMSNSLVRWREDDSRRVRFRDFLITIGFLIVMVAGIVYLDRLPKDSQTAFVQVMQSPFLVMPLWAVMVWVTYRRFQRRQNKRNDNLQAAS